VSAFWEVDISASSEPLTLDVFYDGIASVAGDLSPELRDEYRLRAVEERAESFLRTLAEIRSR
jgi:hypothetical protein